MKAFVRLETRAISVFMALATFVYLIFEFGFNARLLDVVGGMPNEETVRNVEVWGRLISGTAAALVFWPASIAIGKRRNLDSVGTAMLVVVCSIPVISAVYFGQVRLVDSLVDRSTAQERYTAANLTALQHAWVSTKLDLDGMAMNQDDMRKPDGKAFVALFPLLAMSIDQLDRKLQPVKPDVMRSLASASLGNLDVNYGSYTETFNYLKAFYTATYSGASARYTAQTTLIEQRKEKAWAQYVARLKSNRLSPTHTYPWQRKGIRDEVRRNHVPVPDNWEPSDRGGFMRAINKTYGGEQIEDAYVSAMSSLELGSKLPPSMNVMDYFSHPQVQARWLKLMNYEGHRVILPITESVSPVEKDYFGKTVFDSVMGQKQAVLLQRYGADPKTFADNQTNEHFGKAQMRALIVPPIALAFSILGALIHIFKFAMFSVQSLSGWGFSSPVLKFGAVMLLALTSFFSFAGVDNSAITRQSLYLTFEQNEMRAGPHSEGLMGTAIAYFTRSTIHAQVVAYPFFEWVRSSTLDLQYGYSESPKGAGSR